MGERRGADRERTIENGVRCLTELGDGTRLEGIVADVSLGGAKIAGPTTGLKVDDEVRVVFVFLSDEKVGYRCTVRRVVPDVSFGLMFRSGPEPIEIHDASGTVME